MNDLFFKARIVVNPNLKYATIAVEIPLFEFETDWVMNSFIRINEVMEIEKSKVCFDNVNNYLLLFREAKEICQKLKALAC